MKVETPKPEKVELAAPEPAYIACFLCGDSLEIKSSKRAKPYFICDPCGLQVFVRKERGIQYLAKISGPNIPGFNSMVSLLNQLQALNIKLADIREAEPIFKNPEWDIQEKAVISEIQRIQGELISATNINIGKR